MLIFNICKIVDYLFSSAPELAVCVCVILWSFLQWKHVQYTIKEEYLSALNTCYYWSAKWKTLSLYDYILIQCPNCMTYILSRNHCSVRSTLFSRLLPTLPVAIKMLSTLGIVNLMAFKDVCEDHYYCMIIAN